MAEMNFGGVIETVVTSKEFSLEKAREVLKNETIAVLGYGVQGPGQACNLRDNGFNVIVGQRQGKTYDKAVADGWVPGETLFSLEEAAEKGTIVCMLLSDAAQMQLWPTIKPHLTAGKALYFSHGFAINWSDRTGVVPPSDIDVIMVAPKGSGTSLRTMFLEGRGLNSSSAVYQDATGKALEKVLAFGIGIGNGAQGVAIQGEQLRAGQTQQNGRVRDQDKLRVGLGQAVDFQQQRQLALGRQRSLGLIQQIQPLGLKIGLHHSQKTLAMGLMMQRFATVAGIIVLL